MKVRYSGREYWKANSALRAVPNAKERFSTAFQITESSPEDGTFKGLACAFGTRVDTWTPTVIARGAFTKTIRENGKRFRILHQHDSDHPLARPGIGLNPGDMLVETDLGLMVGAKISKTVCGMDCITLLRDKVIDELSIGHDPIRQDYMPLSQAIAEGLIIRPEEWADIGTEQEVRVIRETKLWEASLVTWGANYGATITDVYGQNRIPACYSDLLKPLATINVDPEDEKLIQSVLSGASEQLTGAMLSAKNKKMLATQKQAMLDCADAIQKLLDAAEPPAPSPEPDDTQVLTAKTEREKKLRELESSWLALNFNVS